MDYRAIDNIVIRDIDHNDAPDYVDAYIESADYCGIPMDEEQIEKLNEERSFVYDKVIESLQ